MSDDLIYRYSAEDAMQDGHLMEVDRATSKEAGFKWPVRITSGVYLLVKPSEEALSYGQDFEGRLWDVLTMARLAIQQAPDGENLISFVVHFQNGPKFAVDVTLWAALDMTSGPAIHILKPEEY